MIRSDKTVLAIESSLDNWSLSIFEEGVEKGFAIGNKELPLSQHLMPELAKLLRNNRKKLSDVDLFAVSLGPGSYTGLRVGLATFQSLAFSTNKRCVGVSFLEVLANAYKREVEFSVISMISTGKLFKQTFKRQNGDLLKISEVEVSAIEEFDVKVTKLPFVADYKTADKLMNQYKIVLNEVTIVNEHNLSQYVALSVLIKPESEFFGEISIIYG